MVDRLLAFGQAGGLLGLVYVVLVPLGIALLIWQATFIKGDIAKIKVRVKGLFSLEIHWGTGGSAEQEQEEDEA
jgi:hypothetical protein